MVSVKIEPSVVVITPTTGDEKLLRCMESVNNQTHKNLKHLIVIDGWESLQRLNKLNVDRVEPENREYVFLPTNVGANGFYGHRVYAAFPHLVNEDFVFFLDQDNTYREDHVESLKDTIQSMGIDWAFSLRNIYDKDDKFLCKDDCENLGAWPVWNSPESFHVDTSAYAFKREFLIQVCQYWHSGYAGDRRFLHIMKQVGRNPVTSGKYTLNYYLDGNPNSASPDFFIFGNQKQRDTYGMLRQEFPWKKE